MNKIKLLNALADFRQTQADAAAFMADAMEAHEEGREEDCWQALFYWRWSWDNREEAQTRLADHAACAMWLAAGFDA